MNPKQNRLLAILPEDSYQRILPHLRLVRLYQGQILHLPGEIVEEIYFPLDCLLSIMIIMNNGATTETSLIGNRELLGINALIGGRETASTQYTVQLSGAAVQIKALIIREIFQQDQQFRDVMMRFIQTFIARISQTTACNRLHFLEQRLARWLLEAQERLNSNELCLTQEIIGNSLGVRRPAITLAMQKLQEKGGICYSRSDILILNSKKLEKCSCECLKVVRDEYDRLLKIAYGCKS